MVQPGTGGKSSVDWYVGDSPPVSSTSGGTGLGGTGGAGVLLDKQTHPGSSRVETQPLEWARVLHAIASSEQILQFGTLEQDC